LAYSNFLDIAKATYLRTGGPGQLESVEKQTGRKALAVEWCNTAWLTLQGSHTRWAWMWDRFNFKGSKGKDEFREPTGSTTNRPIRSWDKGVVTVHETDLGTEDETEIVYMPWEEFNECFRIGEIQTERPTYFSITPDVRLVTDTKLDQEYVFQGQLWTRPTQLVNNTDEPGMPVEFWPLIVYDAYFQYAEEYGATVSQTMLLRRNESFSALKDSQWLSEHWRLGENAAAIGST